MPSGEEDGKAWLSDDNSRVASHLGSPSSFVVIKLITGNLAGVWTVRLQSYEFRPLGYSFL